jgi:hypothetical protein
MCLSYTLSDDLHRLNYLLCTTCLLCNETAGYIDVSENIMMFLIFLMQVFSPIFYLYFEDSTLQLEGATLYTGRCVESNLQIH